MMHIYCPYCGAPYDIDTSLLPEVNVKVKCRICSNVFELGKNGVAKNESYGKSPEESSAGDRSHINTGDEKHKEQNHDAAPEPPKTENIESGLKETGTQPEGKAEERISTEMYEKEMGDLLSGNPEKEPKTKSKKRGRNKSKKPARKKSRASNAILVILIIILVFTTAFTLSDFRIINLNFIPYFSYMLEKFNALISMISIF